MLSADKSFSRKNASTEQGRMSHRTRKMNPQNKEESSIGAVIRFIEFKEGREGEISYYT